MNGFKCSQEDSLKVGDIVRTYSGLYGLVIQIIPSHVLNGSSSVPGQTMFDHIIKYLPSTIPSTTTTGSYYYTGLMKL